jgi:uncharacterized protein (DUF1800 family)
MRTQTLDWIAAARIERRTGFGATGPSIDAALTVAPATRIAAILAADPLTDPGAKATPSPTFTPIVRPAKGASVEERGKYRDLLREHLAALTAWWIRRMVAVEQPFGEKLTFGWHNHFATSAAKVRLAPLMLAQNNTLRRLGRGDFGPLAQAMLTDAAMLLWLDGQQNTAKAPNENLSREFLELFALGHGDGYTEADVREGARALTGWRINGDGTTGLRPRLHDADSKTVLGVSGNLDQTAFCDAVLAQPNAAGYLAKRWWGQLVSGSPPTSATTEQLVAAYGPTRNLTALFSAMLTCADFTAAAGSVVIGPVEWLIGAVRALKVPIRDDAAAKKLAVILRALGQIPFYPPNVSGWPSGQAWLSTVAADVRLQAATALAKAGNLSRVEAAAVGDRIDTVGYLLGIGEWSARSSAALASATRNPQQLVAIALNTPEYLID